MLTESYSNKSKKFFFNHCFSHTFHCLNVGKLGLHLKHLGFWTFNNSLYQCHCIAGLFSHSLSSMLCYTFLLLLIHFVHTYFQQFASTEKAEEIEEFFASRMRPSMARTLKQSIERVHINARWVQSVQTDEHLAEAVEQLAMQH